MDKLILSTDFSEPSDEADRAFFDNSKDFKAEELNEEELIKIMQAFGNQIKKYHPLRNSNGHGMFSRVWTILRNVLKEKWNKNLINALFDLIKATLESGWTATNGDLITEFSDIFPSEFFTSMDQEKFQSHMEFMKSIDFQPSEHDAADNARYAYDRKTSFVRIFFFNHFENEMFVNNKDFIQDIVKHFYLQCWSKHEDVCKVNNDIITSIERRVDKMYNDTPAVFHKTFKEISEKLLNEEVVAEEGRKIIENFYSRNYSLMRKSKVICETLMFDWCCYLFKLAKLNYDWIEKITQHLYSEIRMIDDKFVKTAFKDCDKLLGEATEFLSKAIDSYPQSNNEEERDSRKYKDSMDAWKYKCEAIGDKFYKYTVKTSEHFEMLTPVLVKLIPINTSPAIEVFNRSMKGLEKTAGALIKTKPQMINPYLTAFSDYAILHGNTEDRTGEFPFSKSIRSLDECYRIVTDVAKLGKAWNSSVVQDELLHCIVNCLLNFSLSTTQFISGFGKFVVFKNSKVDELSQLIEALNHAISVDEVYDLYNPSMFAIGEVIKNCITVAFTSPVQFNDTIEKLSITVALLSEKPIKVEFQGQDKDSITSLLFLHIFAALTSSKSTDNILVKFYTSLLEMSIKTVDDEGLPSSYTGFLSNMSNRLSSPTLLKPYLPRFLDLVFMMKGTSHESMLSSFFYSLKSICANTANEDLVNRFDDFKDLFFELESEDSVYMSLIEIMTMIFTENTELCSDDILEKAIEKFSQSLSFSYCSCKFMEVIAKKHPEKIVPYLDQLWSGIRIYKLSVVGSIMEIVHDILEADESQGENIFPILVELIDENINDTNFASMLLIGLRVCGILRHDLLVELKSSVEKWQSTNPGVHDVCQHLLDIIADRSLEGLDYEISGQKQALATVDNKIGQQQQQVDALGKDVERHEVAIDDVNQRVDDTNVRVDKVEEDIVILDDQVQEIDLKTVSNAPKWAREVSKLLNPESDADWKLLSSRLGYSTDDIRAWSTNADPCMSLLSDWFSVRRNVEATRAVLEQLIEMDRLDAAEIVEKALTAAEAAITDDEPMEFIEPPLIFLSYQWAIQEEVKLLREHLQMAGYRCWMDIGQMGGGDKLYEAIDRGIRGAKVFISCVTSKYAESPNCKRELNLAISLHKSVIPLQMEKMDWPPPGTMGPLLTEYIFIRMFSRPGTTLSPGTFWPEDRFRELLMQIRYGTAPEYEIVVDRYANWWLPPDQLSNGVPKSTEPESSNGDQDTPKLAEVFLSYQWSKQAQIQALYNLLVGRGFTCWMDIHQMGGGDSLYDKIDKGVRGCKVVVSCVTPKYAESPNCRREVSLADGIKKPIIPILLEHMDWPPQGPMSMSLTQLNPLLLMEEQQNWIGPITDELIQKIAHYFSEKSKLNTSSTMNSSSESTSNKSENQPEVIKPTETTEQEKLPEISSKSANHKPTRKSSKQSLNKAVHVKSIDAKKSKSKMPPNESKSCDII